MSALCPPSRCDDCSLSYVCRCLRVTRAAVAEAVAALELKTVQEVRAHTGAGEGCTACHARLEEVIEEQCYSSSSPIFSDK